MKLDKKNVVFVCFQGSPIYTGIAMRHHFIDPYPSSMETHGKVIVKESVQDARAIWSQLENARGMVNRDQIRRCLPFAAAETIDLLHSKMSNCSASLMPSDLCEARVMAQRTLMGLYSPINLDFYIDQTYRFWHAYLDFFHIDLVVSAITPHSLTDYILSLAAKDLGLSFVCQCVINLRNHSVFLDLSSGEFVKKANIQSEACEALNEFLSSCSKGSGDANIAYPDKLKKFAVSTKKSYKRFLLSGSKSANQILKHKFELVLHYDHLSDQKSFGSLSDKCHIFFLQYQPEATTSPLAKAYADQRLAIREISRRLPDGEKLIVKEHPIQFVFNGVTESSSQHISNMLDYRNREFYDFALSFENVYLMPRNIRNDTILNSSGITIWGLTGTIVLQAFMRGVNFQMLDTHSIYHLLSPHQGASLDQRKTRAFELLIPYMWPLVDIYEDSFGSSCLDLSSLMRALLKSSGQFH